jgi:hypothetical protein
MLTLAVAGPAGENLGSLLSASPDVQKQPRCTCGCSMHETSVAYGGRQSGSGMARWYERVRPSLARAVRGGVGRRESAHSLAVTKIDEKHQKLSQNACSVEPGRPQATRNRRPALPSARPTWAWAVGPAMTALQCARDAPTAFSTGLAIVSLKLEVIPPPSSSVPLHVSVIQDY